MKILIVALAIFLTIVGGLLAIFVKKPQTSNSIVSNDEQKSLTTRSSPDDAVPAFKIVHEDYLNPIPFVISAKSSDEEVKRLLQKIRDSIRSHSYTELGLKPANARSHYNTSGMIEIFRGPKCASETYTEGKWPCGDGDHYAGFYQWGIDGVFTNDDGGYRRASDSSIVTIFIANDGYTMPASLQQKSDAQARVEEASEKAEDDDRRRVATAMETSLRQSGFDINILAGPDTHELIMVSSIFEGDTGRVSFLSNILPKLRPELCKIGFTSIKLQTGMFSLSDPYQIGCK